MSLPIIYSPLSMLQMNKVAAGPESGNFNSLKSKYIVCIEEETIENIKRSYSNYIYTTV